MPVGKGTHSDVSTVGNNDGVAVANRRSKHKHTVASLTATQGTHEHNQTDVTGNAGGLLITEGKIVTGGTGTGYPGQTIQAASAGAITMGGLVGSSTNDSTDAPAYLVINYIIKT